MSSRQYLNSARALIKGARAWHKWGHAENAYLCLQHARHALRMARIVRKGGAL
jgi:hypothetical protein